MRSCESMKEKTAVYETEKGNLKERIRSLIENERNVSKKTDEAEREMRTITNAIRFDVFAFQNRTALKVERK